MLHCWSALRSDFFRRLGLLSSVTFLAVPPSASKHYAWFGLLVHVSRVIISAWWTLCLAAIGIYLRPI